MVDRTHSLEGGAEVGDILGSGTGQAKVGSTLQSSVGIKVSW